MISIQSWIGTILAAVVMTGCSENRQPVAASSGHHVVVMYQADPLADVHVRLYATPDGPVLAEAISAMNGHVHFDRLPSPQPAEYFVSLESISDGGWMLDSKFGKAATSALRLKSLDEKTSQQLTLPRGAVRPFSTHKP